MNLETVRATVFAENTPESCERKNEGNAVCAPIHHKATLPGPTPVGSITHQWGARKMEALKNQQSTRCVPGPPEPVEPQPGFFGRAFSWLRVAAAPKQLQVVETVSLAKSALSRSCKPMAANSSSGAVPRACLS